jgi:hypothetical protein
VEVLEHAPSLPPRLANGKRETRNFPAARNFFSPPQFPYHLRIFTQPRQLVADKRAKGKPAIMIISITVPDTVVRAAQDRNMSTEEFVDTLIDKGMEKATGRPIVSSAIERIRALHTDAVLPRR